MILGRWHEALVDEMITRCDASYHPLDVLHQKK